VHPPKSDTALRHAAVTGLTVETGRTRPIPKDVFSLADLVPKFVAGCRVSFIAGRAQAPGILSTGVAGSQGYGNHSEQGLASKGG